MKAICVEAAGFTECLEDYLTDDHYAELQLHLIENPGAGPVMRGCGGVRKLRWPDPRRGKGKRGGLRILYLHVPEVNRLYFLDVYDKDEADDLTPEQRRILAEVAAESRRDALRGRRT